MRQALSRCLTISLRVRGPRQHYLPLAERRERSTHLRLRVFAEHVQAPAYGRRWSVMTLWTKNSKFRHYRIFFHLAEYFFIKFQLHTLLECGKIYILTANMKVLVSSRMSWSVRPSLRISKSKSSSARRCLAARNQKQFVRHALDYFRFALTFASRELVICVLFIISVHLLSLG